MQKAIDETERRRELNKLSSTSCMVLRHVVLFVRSSKKLIQAKCFQTTKIDEKVLEQAQAFRKMLTKETYSL